MLLIAPAATGDVEAHGALHVACPLHIGPHPTQNATQLFVEHTGVGPSRTIIDVHCEPGRARAVRLDESLPVHSAEAVAVRVQQRGEPRQGEPHRHQVAAR